MLSSERVYLCTHTHRQTACRGSGRLSPVLTAPTPPGARLLKLQSSPRWQGPTAAAPTPTSITTPGPAPNMATFTGCVERCAVATPTAPQPCSKTTHCEPARALWPGSQCGPSPTQPHTVGLKWSHLFGGDRESPRVSCSVAMFEGITMQQIAFGLSGNARARWEVDGYAGGLKAIREATANGVKACKLHQGTRIGKESKGESDR